MTTKCNVDQKKDINGKKQIQMNCRLVTVLYQYQFSGFDSYSMNMKIFTLKKAW